MFEICSIFSVSAIFRTHRLVKLTFFGIFANPFMLSTPFYPILTLTHPNLLCVNFNHFINFDMRWYHDKRLNNNYWRRDVLKPKR